MTVTDIIFQKLRTEKAQQVSREGGFDLPCSADTAFPFFSPEGEREWVKGWNPVPIFPQTTAFACDTVFRQGEALDEAIWTIVDADWKEHRAEYVRLAPASHTAHIVVKVQELAPDRSSVSVRYTVTAFGEHASKVLQPFSEAAYTDKMRNWQCQISECIEIRKQ